MALEGPKGAVGQEIRSAAELSARIFGYASGRLPEPRADEVRENTRVFADGGRTVSVVGMSYRPVRLGGTEHLACCFGGVCTDPDYRGRGLATRLLEDCRLKALADGADLVLISGRRGLYQRAGYCPVGHFDLCTVERHRIPQPVAGYTVRPPLEADLPALMRLHLAESTRFVRSPERLLGLVCGKHIWNGRGETVVVLPNGGGTPVGYLTCQVGGRGQEELPPNHVRVLEVAGPRWALVHALPALMDRHGADELKVYVWGHDTELQRIAADCGWPSEPVTFHGSVGIIHPERFWEACVPLFAGLIGRERLNSLAVSGNGPVRIARGEDELVLENMNEFTRLVFTHPALRGELGPALPSGSPLRQTLDELLPLPLVNYGLTYL
jgi:predicted N-acetyltransferase YhbS